MEGKRKFVKERGPMSDRKTKLEKKVGDFFFEKSRDGGGVPGKEMGGRLKGATRRNEAGEWSRD